MESNIFMIKPDGINRNDFLTNIKESLFANNYQILGIRKINLENSDLDQFFTIKSAEHRKYLLEGPVLAILYRGTDAIKFGRIFKHNLRKRLNTHKIKNLLHSTEPGNEFRIQFKLFFSNQSINEKHHLGFCDQLCFAKSLNKQKLNLSCKYGLIGTNEEMRKLPGRYKVHKNIIIYGLIFPFVFNDIKLEIINYRKVFSDIFIVEQKIIGRSDVNSPLPGVNVLLIKKYNEYLSNNLFANFIKLNIGGDVCYHPCLTLKESELIREKILENNMFCVGGSGGVLCPGLNGISEEVSNLLENNIGKCKNLDSQLQS